MDNQHVVFMLKENLNILIVGWDRKINQSQPIFALRVLVMSVITLTQDLCLHHSQYLWGLPPKYKYI